MLLVAFGISRHSQYWYGFAKYINRKKQGKARHVRVLSYLCFHFYLDGTQKRTVPSGSCSVLPEDVASTVSIGNGPSEGNHSFDLTFREVWCYACVESAVVRTEAVGNNVLRWTRTNDCRGVGR